MRRKLGKKNIKLFVLFSFLVLLVVGLFGYGIYVNFSIDKHIYTVENGSFTYDANNSYVLLEDEGSLQQKWDKKYYLSIKNKDNSKNKVIDLGNDVVIYNDSNTNLKIYGSNYRIDTNGDVTYNDKELEVSRSSSPLFYKLQDRKYLMVSKSITTEKKEINTSGYLIVEIDKSGNALLLNNELNVKTLSTITLKTAGYEFDVANEKLIIPNSKKTIDLKKVSGSSNQYVQPSKEEDDDEEKAGSTGTGGNGVTDGTTFAGGGVVGGITGGVTGSVAGTIVGATTANKSEDLNIIKTAIITSVATYTSYVDVYYAVNDPKGEYVSIFLDIEGSDGYTDRLILNKDLTRYRIRNLKPNTQYKISFGYSYASSENSDIILEDTSNSFVVSTTKNKTKITITKISGKKIYYNATFDQSYAFENANAVVYSDNIPIGRDAIDTALAVRNGGYSNVIVCDNDFGYEIVIKLEDCKYDGESVDVDIQSKFING